VAYATVGLFVSAVITHLCLMLIGGANQGYETTYRVVAFSAGSVAWLDVIPCFGPLIHFVMSFVCPIQGLAAAHHTSVGKAAAAVILPIVLCVALACGSGLLVFFGILANQ
jgi:hypothetical protein